MRLKQIFLSLSLLVFCLGLFACGSPANMARQELMTESKDAMAPSVAGNSVNSRGSEKASLAADASTSSVSNTSPHSSASGSSFQLRPQIIKRATLTVQVEHIDAAMKKLEQLTKSQQGIITNQTLYLGSEGGQHRSGTIEVRVPEEKLSLFLEQLPGVGQILQQQMTGEDVGAQIVDSEARVKNLKVQEETLHSIMKRSGKIPDVLQVANELSTVRGQIEESQSRVAYLKQQVAYSTVSITLAEKNMITATGDAPNLFNAMSTTFIAAFKALYSTLIGLLQLVIWLVVYVLPIVLIAGLAIVLGTKLLWRFVLSKCVNLMKRLFAKSDTQKTDT